MQTATSSRKNKQRFNDEQIKSLEVMFKSDSRPEASAKQQLAGELGLEPRQVAIWFQNRRARSRTKQLEQEYSILKASYNNLASSIESLKRENQVLGKQLQELKSRLGNRIGEAAPTLLFEGCRDEVEVHTSEESCRNVGNFEKEPELLDLSQSTGGSMTSSVNWCSLASSCYLDESSSQWWELWS
ncbi:hypothetical protein UlMin_045873 [Ulmus minor]